MKKVFISIVCIFFLFTLRAAGQKETQEILEKLQNKYAKLQDATFKFSQATKYTVAKMSQTVSGTVKSKKKKYRIETENEWIITDCVSVWRYKINKKQVLLDTYKDDPKTLTPDRVIEQATKEYLFVGLGTEKLKQGERTIVKLTPTSESSSIQTLKLWIDEDALVVTKIEMTDIANNVTTYTISSYTTNTGLPDSLFMFTPPAGVELIDLR
jgi:outer membrane lipoprotein-sorting protein